MAAAGAPNRSLVLSSPSGPTDEDILKHAPIRAEVEAAWKAAATHTPSGARPAPDDVSGCGSSEPVQHTWRTPGEACRSGKPGPGLCEVGAKGFSDRVATTEESAKPHWGIICGRRRVSKVGETDIRSASSVEQQQRTKIPTQRQRAERTALCGVVTGATCVSVVPLPPLTRSTTQSTSQRRTPCSARAGDARRAQLAGLPQA